MKPILIQCLRDAWQALHEQGVLPEVSEQQITLVPTKDPKHGDYASNLALLLAKDARLPSRQLAEQLIAAIPPHPDIENAASAGPGFLNFTLRAQVNAQIIDQILEQGTAFGTRPGASGQKILIEYVSANPTGPLHVGHGRGAATGSCLVRILQALGHTVESEYFVNDAGRQMDILALSVWLRYLELCGEPIAFPRLAYQGDYVLDLAADQHRAHKDAWRHAFESVQSGAPNDGPNEAGSNAHLDALILRAQDLLGAEVWSELTQTAVSTLRASIRRDLKTFGVSFDHWQSERALLEAGQVQQVIEQLEAAGHLYEEEGARWFRSGEFGDEKDRVVQRSNGQWTYFATDIAYHAAKLSRGYDVLINLWGADHHGYADRVRAAMAALGHASERLEILWLQFANLYRGEERLAMSTRSGQFVPLQALTQEIGRDAARFFYVMRNSSQHLDFDLELAVQQTSDNPVYYVQYAHARVCRVLERAQKQSQSFPVGACDLSVLIEAHEHLLQKELARYPSVLQHAAQERQPHHLTVYLRKLAQEFHTYYNAVMLLVDDEPLRHARIRLILAVRQVLANGLDLLGIEAPESM